MTTLFLVKFKMRNREDGYVGPVQYRLVRAKNKYSAVSKVEDAMRVEDDSLVWAPPFNMYLQYPIDLEAYEIIE